MKSNSTFCQILLSVMILLQTACGGNSSPSVSEGTANNGQNTPQSGSVGDFKLSCEEAQFITTLNIYRAQNSRAALQVSKAGVLAGRWHASNMIELNYFSHTEPNGRDAFSRMAAFGYGGSGENIAAGNTSALNTFCQWKNSPGHNANMLNAQFTSTGIGRAAGGGNYGVYWSSNFGGSVSDDLAEPLTSEAGCNLIRTLPGC